MVFSLSFRRYRIGPFVGLRFNWDVPVRNAPVGPYRLGIIVTVVTSSKGKDALKLP